MNDTLKNIAPLVTDYTYKPRAVKITGNYEKTFGEFVPFALMGIDAIRLRIELLTIEEECRCVGR